MSGPPKVGQMSDVKAILLLDHSLSSLTDMEKHGTVILVPRWATEEQIRILLESLDGWDPRLSWVPCEDVRKPL